MTGMPRHEKSGSVTTQLYRKSGLIYDFLLGGASCPPPRLTGLKLKWSGTIVFSSNFLSKSQYLWVEAIHVRSAPICCGYQERKNSQTFTVHNVWSLMPMPSYRTIDPVNLQHEPLRATNLSTYCNCVGCSYIFLGLSTWNPNPIKF